MVLHDGPLIRAKNVVVDGTAALPGLRWGADPDSGFYRIGENNIGLSLGGVKIYDFGAVTLGLVSGAVFNWNAGNVTLTHSANALTLAGGNLVISALKVGADTANNYISWTTGVLNVNSSAAGMNFAIDTDNDTTTALFSWYRNAVDGTGTLMLRLDEAANLQLGAASVGAGSPTNTIIVANGTVPTTSPLHTVTLYSTDIAAGHTEPSFYCEGTQVLATGQADSASSVRVKMRINGTEVTLLAV